MRPDFGKKIQNMVLKLEAQGFFYGFVRQKVVCQIQPKPVIDPFDFVL